MVSAELVAQMGKEFDLDSIDVEQKMIVDGIYFLQFGIADRLVILYFADLPANIQVDSVVLPSWKDVVSLSEEKMDIDKPSSTKVIWVVNRISA